MSSARRVLVIGGGLGGLCLAQGLHKAGAEVAVYERDPALAARSQGYRVHLDNRGIQPLHDCLPTALFDLFEATGGQPSTGMTIFRVTATGLAEQYTVRFPDGDGEVLARPGRAVDRLTLREILLAGLDGMVHLGKEFTRYELLPTGEVQAHFADGSAATGDLLVGADGVNSRVRQQLLPEVTLTDTGTRWLGGRTPLDAGIRALLPAELSDRAVSVFDDGTTFFLAAVQFQNPPSAAARRLWSPVRFTHDEDYVMWALIGRPGQLPIPDEDLAVMDAARLHRTARQATADRHPMLAALVRAAPPDSCFYLAIRATAPVEDWPAGPVTLLGDAIHAGPVNGNGANSALRDAGLLRHHLTTGAPLPQAVHAYQIEMLRLARAVREATDAQIRTMAGRDRR